MSGAMTLRPVGRIHTPFHEAKGTPIQPSRASGAAGRVEVFEEYRPALDDLAGFGRIWLVYWFHRAPEARLRVRPFLDTRERGLFATRAPVRPNPIGMSAVRLLAVHGRTLEVADVDILDGTPLLDIKPYVPEFDCHAEPRIGWYSEAGEGGLADDRFRERP